MKGAEFGRRWDCPKRFGFSWAFCYNFVRGRIFRAAPVGILRFRAAGGIQQHVENDYDIIIYYQYIIDMMILSYTMDILMHFFHYLDIWWTIVITYDNMMVLYRKKIAFWGEGPKLGPDGGSHPHRRIDSRGTSN